MQRACCLLLLCSVLAACSEDEHSDIKEWMAEESKNIKGGVKQPPPLITPPIVSYSAKDLMSPFAPEKARIKEVGVNDQNGPGGGRAPEYLEGFPLESMRLIGVIDFKGQVFALIQTPEKPKHVTVGNYIGPNFGKIVEITKTQMRIAETVKDANDLWVKRDKILYLQQDEGATK
jgi:type IV pilus assembly protein PilP